MNTWQKNLGKQISKLNFEYTILNFNNIKTLHEEIFLLNSVCICLNWHQVGYFVRIK